MGPSRLVSIPRGIGLNIDHIGRPVNLWNFVKDTPHLLSVPTVCMVTPEGRLSDGMAFADVDGTNLKLLPSPSQSASVKNPFGWTSKEGLYSPVCPLKQAAYGVPGSRDAGPVSLIVCKE